MYPAQGLTDGFYAAEDLPDSVLFATSGSIGDFVEAVKGENGNFVIVDGFAAGEDIVLGASGTAWSVWVEAGSGPEFIIGDYNGDCLINWPYSDFNRIPAIQDNFADTYTATLFEGSITISRISLCRWEGVQIVGDRLYEVFLEFQTFALSGLPEDPFLSIRWFAGGGYGTIGGQGDNAAAGPKEGFMNDPKGTYIDEISFSEITIS
jgi:hypothetical protein